MRPPFAWTASVTFFHIWNDDKIKSSGSNRGTLSDLYSPGSVPEYRFLRKGRIVCSVVMADVVKVSVRLRHTRSSRVATGLETDEGGLSDEERGSANELGRGGPLGVVLCVDDFL